MPGPGHPACLQLAPSQYVRQTTPGSSGVVEILEDVHDSAHLNGDFTFGAFVQDVQENLRVI